jgi:hypothetical protein
MVAAGGLYMFCQERRKNSFSCSWNSMDPEKSFLAIQPLLPLLRPENPKSCAFFLLVVRVGLIMPSSWVRLYEPFTHLVSQFILFHQLAMITVKIRGGRQYQPGTHRQSNLNTSQARFDVFDVSPARVV